MSKRNFVTLYRYRYHDKEVKIDKFEYCEKLFEGDKLNERYYVYSGPNSYSWRCVLFTRRPYLDTVNSNYVMWSVSPDKKDKFLFEVREKKYEKLKDLLAKADKFQAEIDWMDKELKL